MNIIGQNNIQAMSDSSLPGLDSFSIPNAGKGPDPFGFEDLEERFVLLFFQRDYFCTNCRQQVKELATTYDRFTERGTEVISVLPEPKQRAKDWVETYDLPFPLLADPNNEMSDAFDQDVRFGILGRFSDFLGRMPKIVGIDTKNETVFYEYSGSSTFDRPKLETVIGAIPEK